MSGCEGWLHGRARRNRTTEVSAVRIAFVSLGVLALVCVQVGAAWCQKLPGPAERAGASAKPLDIPAGAQQIEPNTWRYTDKEGRRWVYRQTPFGLVRYPEPVAPATEPQLPASSGIRAWDEGSRIRFERPGPFGVYRWYRAKTEPLSPEEQRAWQAVRDTDTRDPLSPDVSGAALPPDSAQQGSASTSRGDSGQKQNAAEKPKERR